MMKLTKLIQTSVYAIAALSFALISACGQSTSNLAAAPQVGFKTLAGKQFDTASLKGQVTLINFWATSCTTCVKEMPMLTEVFNSYNAKGYRTIAVAMDYDTPTFIANFSESRKLPFDVVHDADGSIAKAFDGTKLTPTSYLIDRQGRVAKRYVGEPNHDEFKAVIEALLKA
jgi:peroxiredoxin